MKPKAKNTNKCVLKRRKKSKLQLKNKDPFKGYNQIVRDLRDLERRHGL